MNGIAITMDVPTFWNRFRPLHNHIDPEKASRKDETGQVNIFETFGKELTFVHCQRRNKIWTLIDGEDGRQHIISGFHTVDRVGYLVTEVPFDGDYTIPYED